MKLPVKHNNSALPKTIFLAKASVLFCMVFVFLFSTRTVAQLSTTVGAPGNMVQNVLLGPGITVSDITFAGAPAQIGSFTYGGGTPNLGLTSGVILSSGNIGDGQGANTSTSSGVDFNRAGDGTLDNLVVPENTYDAAVLEFDFVPQSSNVSFRYVFASEEYPEFVGSAYNDVFGFFISGPGIVGEQNIALIPGTNTAVAINNVNQGAFPQYYRDNTGGGATEYDGFTAVLTTASINVTACQEYHIRIAVADVADGIYDSAVLLEASSFKSASQEIGVSVTFGSDSTRVYEGCGQANIRFTKTNQTNITDSIQVFVAGTATNGVDYTSNGGSFPSWAYFAPNTTTTTIPLVPVNDGISEGPETIIIEIRQQICGQIISKKITLTLENNDPITVSVTPADTSIICPNVPIQLTATAQGGIPPLNYNWDTGQTGAQINVFPLQTTVYTVTVSDACSSPTAQAQAVVRLPGYTPLDIIVPPDTTICPGDSVQLSVQGIGGRGQLTYSWSNGLDSTTTVWVKPETTQIYAVNVVDSCGTTVTKSITVTVLPTNADFDYYYITNRTIKFVDLSSADVVNWYWDFGDGDTSRAINPIHAYGDTGWYNVRLVVENLIGCTDTLIKYIRAYPDYTFYVPNAFTPNGDLVNDNFSGLGQGFVTYEMYIFNRWGEEVFKSESYNSRWDGRDKSGRTAPQGVYVYQIKVKTPPGDSFTLRGMVALIN